MALQTAERCKNLQKSQGVDVTATSILIGDLMKKLEVSRLEALKNFDPAKPPSDEVIAGLARAMQNPEHRGLMNAFFDDLRARGIQVPPFPLFADEEVCPDCGRIHRVREEFIWKILNSHYPS